jgi:hypothetical protein
MKKTYEHEGMYSPTELGPDEESFLFFLTVLKADHTYLYNNILYFFSLLGRMHTRLGPLTSLVQGVSFILQKEDRTLLCEITDRILIHQMRDGEIYATHVVVGWVPLIRIFEWLLRGEP